MKSIKPTYRIIAGLLAMLMFFTSAGLAVDMHYCQGQLKSFSLFGKAKNCHEMMQAKASCSHHQKMATATDTTCSEDEKDCCKNKTVYLESDQDQVQAVNSFVIDQSTQLFVTAFVKSFFEKVLVEKETPVFAKYKPPLILRDVPVLFQSFLL